MKFRDLKHKEWVICFDEFYTKYDYYDQVQVSCRCKDGKFGLSATYEWEYDNGLYTETGREPFKVTWKDVKHNLTHYDLRRQEKYRMPYYVYLYDGKCKVCGRSIEFSEFEAYAGWTCEECWRKIYEAL